MDSKFLRLLVEELKAASDKAVEETDKASACKHDMLAIGMTSAALVSAVLADCIENALNKCGSQSDQAKE